MELPAMQIWISALLIILKNKNLFQGFLYSDILGETASAE